MIVKIAFPVVGFHAFQIARKHRYVLGGLACVPGFPRRVPDRDPAPGCDMMACKVW